MLGGRALNEERLFFAWLVVVVLCWVFLVCGVNLILDDFHVHRGGRTHFGIMLLAFVVAGRLVGRPWL
jgi:hypothetical protein